MEQFSFVFVLLIFYYVAISVVTFAAFCLDKRRAVRHEYRISESVLLGLSLAGGAVGGIVAMRLVRHKTRKWRFAVGLPAFVVFHAMLLVVLMRGFSIA